MRLSKPPRVAKSRLAPARVGYGTTRIDLNVNRDLFNRKLEWRQEPNPDGPSDKTLAVVEFLGGDNVPIAGVHELRDAPDQLLLERRHQRRFSGRGLALHRGSVRRPDGRHIQSGRVRRSEPARLQIADDLHGPARRADAGRGPFIQTVGDHRRWRRTVSAGFNAQRASASDSPIPDENLDAYKKVLARTGDYVHMLGSMIGSSAVRVMRESIQPRTPHASGPARKPSPVLAGSASTPTIRRERMSFQDTRTDQTST